jgi:hypothetical protein
MRKATNGFKKPESTGRMPEPIAFRQRELVIYFGGSISENYIEEQLRAGKIPFRWVAGARVISRRDADAWFESLPYAKESKAPLRNLPDAELHDLFFDKLTRFNRRTELRRRLEHLDAEEKDPTSVFVPSNGGKARSLEEINKRRREVQAELDMIAAIESGD